MKVAINFADQRFEIARKYNTYSAYKYGKFDKVIEYSPDSIDENFKNENSQWFIESHRVIGRYGLWRPHIVIDALSKMELGDYLCYSDAGTYFVKSVDYLINTMESHGDDMMVFGLPFVEKQWTKRDIFIYLNADTESIVCSPQILSTIFIVKKSLKTIDFFEKFKQLTFELPNLFTDEENRLGKANYEEFLENRHNQSILSVLAKLHALNVYRDPSEYGLKPNLYRYSMPDAIFIKNNYDNSDYPQIIVHHRSKKVLIDVKVFAFIRRYFPPYIAVKLFKFAHWLKYAFKEEKYG